MATRIVTIVNKFGLHARAAAKFVQIASDFSCKISLKYDGKEVNGKSIMGVMMLAAGKGAKIEIIAYGSDEAKALDALKNTLLDRFGEGE